MPRSRSFSVATGSSGRGAARASGEARSRGRGPDDRRDGRLEARAPRPRPAPGPRVAVGEDDGARRAAPGRDRDRGTDLVRPVHGACAVRARARLLPAARSRPRPAGDFITAPETHPIFGAAVGRLIEEAWMALGPARALRRRRARRRHRGARGGPARRAAGRRLAAVRGDPLPGGGGRDRAARGAPRAARCGRTWTPRSTPATPWRTVRGRRRGRRERGARCAAGPPGHRPSEAASASSWWGSSGGRFAWVEADPTTEELAERLGDEGIELEDGQAAEVCLGVETWLAGAVDGLDRGVVVLVDYGEEPASLYAPRRRDGTLRGFARHGVGGDPFRHLGRQDLTATVDLAAVRAAAALAGLEPVGETTQAELLAATSGDLAASILHRPGATIEDALAPAVRPRPAARPARHGRLPRPGLRTGAAGRRGAAWPAPAAGARKAAARGARLSTRRSGGGAVGPALRTGSQARDRC